MIFNTIDNPKGKNFASKYGVLGKSFSDIKKDYNNGVGLGTSIFSGNKSTKSDIEAVKNMAKEMKNGVTFGAAWRNNMQNCTDATRRMVVECRRSKGDISELASNLDNLGASSKAAELGMKALSVAANMALVFIVSELISGIYQFAQASKDIANSAQEIGSKFKDTEKDISSYKKKVEELQGIINDSSSSIDDVAKAREELMTIQDELIEKYGTEEASIKNITDAVNGQAKAWENLTRQQWIDAKNDFNNNDIIKNFSNFIHIFLQYYHV